MKKKREPEPPAEDPSRRMPLEVKVTEKPMEYVLGQYIKRLHGQLRQAGPDRPVADLLLEGDEILKELKLEPQPAPLEEPTDQG